MLKIIKKITDPIFNQPFLYHNLRSFFLGGLPTPPLIRLIEPQPSDVILDIGCGTGFLAEEIPFQRYLGFDSDPKVIEIAQRKKIPNAVFATTMIQDFDFSTFHPTKAVLYGILHHLNDRDADALLKVLAKTGATKIVTMDPVYSKFHVLSNLLCRLDRGQFVRTEEKMLELIRKTGLEIETQQFHHSNTGIAKFIVFRLIPPAL